MSFPSSPVTPLELLKRQLADWQQFHADLTLNDEAMPADLAYAQRKIDQLTEEINQYSTSKNS